MTFDDQTPEDTSNGWEDLSPDQRTQLGQSRVGVDVVAAWARGLPKGAAVVDVGCGPGGPRSAALVRPEFGHYAIEASPSLAALYRERFPEATVACEAAEDSGFFGRRFDGAMAWGVLFLLPAAAQVRVIGNVGRALDPGGRFLFTAPRQVCSWNDLFTGRLSVSLGAPAYESALRRAGMTLVESLVDEGDNHYFAAIKV